MGVYLDNSNLYHNQLLVHLLYDQIAFSFTNMVEMRQSMEQRTLLDERRLPERNPAALSTLQELLP